MPSLSTHMRTSSISPSPTEPVAPRWSRRSLDTAASRRLSRASGRHASRLAQARFFVKQAIDWGLGILTWYMRLPFPQQALLGLAGLVLFVLCVLALVYTRAFFDWLGPVAEKWRQLPGGWLINFAMVFVTSFPPVIGYATATTVAGYVWGFPWGWPIAAAACTLGSLCAFIASRTVLGNFVERWVGKDPRFMALAQVMRQEGILYLTAIRFCPLPFSLSNGFLATIPSITPFAFTVSTAISSVKLLVHVFIGSRLAILFERGDEMTTGDKALNWAGMTISSIIGLAVGYIIYRRTMQRATEIAHEQGIDEGASDAEEGRSGYVDSETTLLDPEDAAAIMSDDDLSMWDAQGASFSDEEDGSDPGSNGNSNPNSKDMKFL